MIEGRRQQPGRRGPDRMRRQVIVLTILLIAVLVMRFYFKAWLDGLAEGGEPIATVATVSESSESEPPTSAAFAAEAVPSTRGPEAAPIGDAPTRQLRVILLPARAASPDPASVAFVDTVRHATLGTLRGMPNIEVVDVSSAELAAIVPPNAGPLFDDDLGYFVLSRYYEATLVAEIFEQSAPDGVTLSTNLRFRLRVRGPDSGSASIGTFNRVGSPAGGDDPVSLGVNYAYEIAQRVARLTMPVAASNRARAIFLDTTRSEDERLSALQGLRNDTLDSEVLTAATVLAARSDSAQTRQEVWRVLRLRTYDTALVQPLSYALLTDLEAQVRREAALGLAAYFREANIQTVLEHAARNDSSPEVRLAARMAMMEFDEQQSYERDILLDRSLTPAERLAPTLLTTGNGFVLPPASRVYDTAAAEEALAFAEILSATEDPDLELGALTELFVILNGAASTRYRADIAPDITRALLQTAMSPDERVRQAALSALTMLSQHPKSRAELEAVVEAEPELAARLPGF